MLALGGIVAAVAAAPVAAAVAERPFDRLRRAFEAARAATERYEHGTYRPARDRFQRVLGAAPPTSIEMVATSGRSATIHYSHVDQLPPWPAYDAAREMKWAHDAYLRRHERLERRLGMLAVEDAMRRLDDAERVARERLMAAPAPDATALAYKLRLALEPDELWDDEREALAADARRLAA